MSSIESEIISIKLEIDQIKPGMVTSKDIITESGIILLSKNTVISSMNFNKLVENNIKSVFVKQADINITKRKSMPLNEPVKEEPQKLKSDHIAVSVAQRELFKRFEEAYTEKVEITKNYIKAISEGEKVNLEELYELTDGIMNKLKCKSDVLTFIGFLKEHDEYTFSHSSNVALLCNLFASWIGLSEEEKVYLTTAGLLHDIGKMKIPHHILNKKGRLTDYEFEIIKKHTILGYRILQNQDIPNEIKLGALMHHERIDGSGYPLGVDMSKISKYAKIISICDIYDAMTADRIYRGRICPFEVIRKFEVSSYGELDTTYLLVFLKNIAYTYYGSWVRLNDGRTGEIVFINPKDLSRPMVRINNDIVDLHEAEELKIVGVI